MLRTGREDIMYTFETTVRYSECNSRRQAGLANVLDYLQDTCSFQAEHLDVGVSYLKEHDIVWVLSSWQVDIVRYPAFGERIFISTWPYGYKGFYGYRNFLIKDAGGDTLVRANSVWVFMDLDRGRPAKITKEMEDAYRIEPRLEMEYLDRRISGVQVEETGAPFAVPRHFIDTNNHMNNAKYVLLAEELLPENYNVWRIRAEYRRSALLGDVLVPGVSRSAERIAVMLDDGAGTPYAVMELYGKDQDL